MSHSKILGLSALSLLLCLLTLPTLFLILPVFLFPLLACLISTYVYRRGLRDQQRGFGIRAIALLPFPLALLTFGFCMLLIQQGYQA